MNHYWISVLLNIKYFLSIMATLFIMTAILSSLYTIWVIENYKGWKKRWGCPLASLSLSIIMLLIWSFIP